MRLNRFNVYSEQRKLKRRQSLSSNIRIRTIVLSVFILVGSIMLFTYSKYSTTVKLDVIHAKVGQFVLKLNYNANGGNVNQTYKDLNKGDTYGELPTPTRNGYVFNGWWTDSENGTQVTPSTEMEQSDTTIYAHWIKGRYDLIVKPNTGEWETHTSDQTYNLEYEEEKAIADPTKEGYTFTGWTLNGNGSTIQNNIFKMGYENTTLTANYSINSYTLTIDLDDGTEEQEYELDYGETKTINDPEREGYTFTGWTNTDYINDGVYTQPASDIEIKATWRANDYKWIAYHKKMDLNGTTYTLSETDEGEGAYDTNFSGTVKTYSGFNKPSTQTKKIKVENNYPPTTNVINYEYNRNQYKLTVKPNGGSYAGSTTDKEYNLYYEQTQEISNPTRTCYTFNNWTKTGNSTLTNGILKMGTEATTLTANWNIIQYSITFNPNNGVITNSSDATQIVNCGSSISLLTSSQVTRAGYNFDGWYTAATGGTQVEENMVPTQSTTMFAHWMPIEYTLTYNNEGGNGCTTKKGLYDSVWGTLCEPTNNDDNYVFDGWYTGSNGTGTKIDSSSIVNGDIEVHAKWRMNSVSCSSGKYLPANSSTCSTCPANSYCEGGTYTPSSSEQGRNYCSSLGYSYSESGSDSSSDCYISISGGYYKTSANGNTTSKCSSGTYKGSHNSYYGSSDSCSSCTSLGSNYQYSATGSTSSSSCYMSVSGGYYKTSANGNTTSKCSSGTYKGSHNSYYGSSDSCSNCSPGTTSSEGASSCYTCSNSSNVSTWSSGCTISTCKSGYKVSNNKCVSNTCTYTKSANTTWNTSSSMTATYNCSEGTGTIKSCTLTYNGTTRTCSSTSPCTSTSTTLHGSSCNSAWNNASTMRGGKMPSSESCSCS